MYNNYQELRAQLICDGLALDLKGLEISPLYRPTVTKDKHDVLYTDYCSENISRKKHANYEHPEIVDIDFIWKPGSTLRECTPNDNKFSWVIASHVLEHVPDPLGWLCQIFKVLHLGGKLSLVLPNKQYSFDYFRKDTSVAEIIHAWLHKQQIPSSLQLFDFLTRSVSDTYKGTSIDTNPTKRFESAKRSYTDQDALNFVLNAWKMGSYVDAHCSVFSPETFPCIINQLNNFGLLHVAIEGIYKKEAEFFVKLLKKGEPAFSHPGNAHPNAIFQSKQRIHTQDSKMFKKKNVLVNFGLWVRKGSENLMCKLICFVKKILWVIHITKLKVKRFNRILKQKLDDKKSK